MTSREGDPKPFIGYERAVELLTRLLQMEDRLSESEIDAFIFIDIQARQAGWLSPRQILWVQNVALRLELIEEPAANAWSSLSPTEQARIRGRDVPTPAVLLNRPLDPPGRVKKP